MSTSLSLRKLAARMAAYGEKLVDDTAVINHDRKLFQSDNEQVQKLLEDSEDGLDPEDHKDKRDRELVGDPMYDEVKNLARYYIEGEQQTGVKPPGPEAATAKPEDYDGFQQ